MGRSPSPSPAKAEGDGDDEFRRRLFLLSAAALLLCGPLSPCGYPLAVAPYLYISLMQHALRGCTDRRVWAALWPAVYAAMLVGLYGFLPVNGPGYVLLTGVIAVFPVLPFYIESALASKLYGQCAAPPLASTLLMPIVVVAVDFLWASFMLYGSYGLFAYTQYGMLPVMQLASVFGIYGISFFISWSASLLAWLLGTQQDAAAMRAGLRWLVLLWATVLLFGGSRIAMLQQAPDARVVRVAAITAPNTALIRNALIRQHLGEVIDEQDPPLWGGFGAWDDMPQLCASDREWALTALEEAARPGHGGGAEILILPELGLSTLGVAEEAALVSQAQAIADKHKAVIALPLGANKLDAFVEFPAILAALVNKAGSQGVEENKIRVLQPSGDGPGWQYWKRNLVPVIEEPFTNIDSVYGHAGNATPEVHETRAGRLGTAICFDMEHPAFIRRSAATADILMNPSYDWPGLNPYHAHIAAFRAVETGASVVHHCMVGTSQAYDYLGAVLSHNDHFSRHERDGSMMVAMVPAQGVSTMYATVVGDALPLACLMILLFLGLLWPAQPAPLPVRRGQRSPRRA